jgi:GDPmannose 4,6-dehydratase
MKKKIAQITGITGQDGSYLAEFLLSKNYTVVGVNRRTSTFNTARIDHLLAEYPQKKNSRLYLKYGDLTDGLSLNRIINDVMPDEIYNLAAQSHVAVSFEEPEYTADTIALGTLRLLENIKMLRTKKKIKFYNASTSEIFGNSTMGHQNEKTPFHPKSPYGTAKLYSHWITSNYRDAYNIFACNGILFNHESPRRGDTFVTKKIIKSLVEFKYGSKKKLFLGNLYAKRDWGHARDYVKMQWLMLQRSKPEDFVIASGKQYTVKDFINKVCLHLDLKIKWIGKGLKEKGIINGKVFIEVKENFFRPGEVNQLVGDSSKAYKILGWKNKTSIEKLIEEMCDSEIKNLHH